jgi:hypothetical protein
MKNITHPPEMTRIMMTEKSPTKGRVDIPRLTIVGITALILGLGIALYLKRDTQGARFSSLSDGAVEEDWSM